MFVFKNGNLFFFELATTLKNLGAKWLSETKLISHLEDLINEIVLFS